MITPTAGSNPASGQPPRSGRNAHSRSQEPGLQRVSLDTIGAIHPLALAASNITDKYKATFRQLSGLSRSDELIMSISAPVILLDGAGKKKNLVIGGFNSLRIARISGQKEIYAIVFKKLTDNEIREISILSSRTMVFLSQVDRSSAGAAILLEFNRALDELSAGVPHEPGTSGVRKFTRSTGQNGARIRKHERIRDANLPDGTSK